MILNLQRCFGGIFLYKDRKLETSDIPIDDLTTMLKLMIDHPALFFEKRQSIIMRMV